MSYKEINCHMNLAFIDFFICFIGLIMVSLSKNTNVIVAILLICCGVYNIYTAYKKTKILVSSISIFSLIWLILMPLTSGQVPLMEKMSTFQWTYYLSGCLCFIGGLFISELLILLSVKQRKKSYEQRGVYENGKENERWAMSKLLYSCCIFVLILDIALYLIQAKIAGGFPIFAFDSSTARSTFFTVNGAALASNLGFLCIFLIFCDENYRKRKMFWLLTVTYLIIQVLMTVRFLLFLVIITLISTFSNKKLNKKQLKLIFAFCIAAVICFIIISLFRGGIEDKENYFINTGIYNGTAKDLVNTEIIRYFGMSQRTMESYIKFYEPGISNMGHTFYPILDTIGIEPIIPRHYGIYGYTACNIITYFYFDAGSLWWLLMIFWSIIMNNWYYKFRANPNSIINKYLWGISALGIAMSFYCYIDSYPYWYFHYIVILYFIKIFNSRLKLYHVVNE